MASKKRSRKPKISKGYVVCQVPKKFERTDTGIYELRRCVEEETVAVTFEQLVHGPDYSERLNNELDRISLQATTDLRELSHSHDRMSSPTSGWYTLSFVADMGDGLRQHVRRTKNPGHAQDAAKTLELVAVVRKLVGKNHRLACAAYTLGRVAGRLPVRPFEPSVLHSKKIKMIVPKAREAKAKNVADRLNWVLRKAGEISSNKQEKLAEKISEAYSAAHPGKSFSAGSIEKILAKHRPKRAK